MPDAASEVHNGHVLVTVELDHTLEKEVGRTMTNEFGDSVRPPGNEAFAGIGDVGSESPHRAVRAIRVTRRNRNFAFPTMNLEASRFGSWIMR